MGVGEITVVLLPSVIWFKKSSPTSMPRSRSTRCILSKDSLRWCRIPPLDRVRLEDRLRDANTAARMFSDCTSPSRSATIWQARFLSSLISLQAKTHSATLGTTNALGELPSSPWKMRGERRTDLLDLNLQRVYPPYCRTHLHFGAFQQRLQIAQSCHQLPLPSCDVAFSWSFFCKQLSHAAGHQLS